MLKCARCGIEVRQGDSIDHMGGIVRHRTADTCIEMIRAAHENRVAELLAANNAELQRRRKFEDEANQEYTEKLLLRSECMRLREALTTLSGYVDKLHADSGQAVPEDVAVACWALFPPEPLAQVATR